MTSMLTTNLELPLGNLRSQWILFSPVAKHDGVDGKRGSAMVGVGRSSPATAQQEPKKTTTWLKRYLPATIL